MARTGIIEKIRQTVADRSGEPVLAAVFVHRGPKTGSNGLKRLFGTKNPASRLNTNNYLVLTPHHLRLYALGGRNAMTPKEEIAAWPLGQVCIEANDVDRSAFFNTTMSSYDYAAHQLRILAPDVDLLVDMMADTEREFVGVFGMDPESDLRVILHATNGA